MTAAWNPVLDAPGASPRPLSAAWRGVGRQECLPHVQRALPARILRTSNTATFGVLPPGTLGFPKVFSALAHLLPYLEQEQLTNLLNYSDNPLPFSSPPPNGATNDTAARRAIALFLCPSDLGNVPNNNYGPNNYVANLGSGLVDNGVNNLGDGVIFARSSVRFRDILDGTAKTAAFSESLVGNGITSAGNRPADAQREVLEFPSAAFDPSGCLQGMGGVWNGQRGGKWINGHYADTLYNHRFTPNNPQWDCGNLSHNRGATAARSNHPGGVNLLLCDGSVQFIGNSIDEAVWHAVATRAGNEAATF